MYWSRHGVFVGTKWLGKCDNKINACAQKTIEGVWTCGLKLAIMKCGVFSFHPTWKLIPWKAIQPENFLGSTFQRTPSRLVPSVGCSSHGKSTAGKGPPPKQGKGVPKKVLQIIGSFNQAIKQPTNQANNHSIKQSSNQPIKQTIIQSSNQATNQSSKQSINQSINQPIKQTIIQSSNQATNQSSKQSFNQAIKQPTNQANNQSINQSTNQANNHSIKQSSNQPIKQTIIQSSNQATNQSSKQSINQSINQSIKQTNKQTNNSWRQALWNIGVLMKPSLQRRPPCLWVGACQCGTRLGHGKLYRNLSAKVGAADIGMGTIFYSYS